MSIILADGWVVTMNGRREVLDAASILIDGDRIGAHRVASHAPRTQPRGRGLRMPATRS